MRERRHGPGYGSIVTDRDALGPGHEKLVRALKIGVYPKAALCMPPRKQTEFLASWPYVPTIRRKFPAVEIFYAIFLRTKGKEEEVQRVTGLQREVLDSGHE
ncbi:hypothetical protein GWK47_019707 [Chionoecetes opilio]|uniref:Uncharacterized protein n=1 Tax=Chionoecetes opilio TaxID=41210 RepID=A0A8J4XPQ8_CHIOP|nr:hypothetical protein GWK47_019707 [Chionoecetes opilio]